MARKLYYKIIDDGSNTITEAEWEEVSRLQHWYNTEFIWTAGKLAFKMFAVFPNEDWGGDPAESVSAHIARRRSELKADGLSENDIIRELEKAGMVILKRGGYLDECLASGFTRVAANEWNAYLVCEFLLKASRIIVNSRIMIQDEGGFVKSRTLFFRRGGVVVPVEHENRKSFYQALVTNRHVFSIVDPAKYDQFPAFKSTVANFNELDQDERRMILKDWNWLGFENNYDINGDDIQGFNLNKKVTEFHVLASP